MSTFARSPWLPLSLVVFGCLMYGVAAQSFAPPVIQHRALAYGPEAVKAEDVVNVGGRIAWFAGTVQADVYTVPLGKRLIVTTFAVEEGAFDLVEENAGVITRKVTREMIRSIGPGYATVVLSLAYPLGLRFEPGSIVGLRRDNDAPLSNLDEVVPVLLVGALVDAY